MDFAPVTQRRRNLDAVGAHLRCAPVLVALLTVGFHAPARAAIAVQVADDTSVDSSEVSALTAEAQREFQAIANSLGVDPDKTVEIVIASEFDGRSIEISQAYPEDSLILIPPHILTRGIVPLAHELTHVIAGPAADEVLSEGLAVYNQDKFGKDPAFPNFGRPVRTALYDALASRYGVTGKPDAVWALDVELGQRRMAKLTRWIDDVDNDENRTLAYLTAASYVRYLIDGIFQGDEKAFLLLYRSGDYGQAGISPETAWSGWLRDLQDH